MRKVLFALVVIALVSLGVIVIRTRPRTTPSPSLIAAALRNQESRCGRSLQVDYTLTAVSSGPGPSAGVRARMHYVRTPELLFMEQNGRSPLTGPRGDTIRYSYDRTKMRLTKLFLASNGDLAGEILNGGFLAVFSTQSHIETTRYSVFTGPLCDAVEYATVRDTMETVDGHRCWRLEVNRAGRAMEGYRAWLDPGIGFCPRRIEFHWQGERVSESASFTGYRKIARGVWFPMKLTVEAPGPNGNIITNVAQVTDIAVDVHIPRDKLLVSFPSGTCVTVDGGTAFTRP